MSVGAIRADSKLSNPYEMRSTTYGAGHVGIDFLTLLGALRGGEGARPSFAAGSAVKAEVSRAVSIAGGVRRMVITYTDGTSETEVSAAGSAQDLSPTVTAESGSAWLQTIKAESELAPETGTLEPAAAPITWRILSNGRLAAGGTASAEPQSEHRRGVQVPADRHAPDNSMGRLVDLLL